jgi:hypothetical protein
MSFVVLRMSRGNEFDYAELTDEEVIETIEAERRRTLVGRVLKSLPGT